MKAMKINILTLITLLAFAMTFTSCEEEAVRGCTDPEAENYDALAVEDDGACSYTRDKFLGSYSGDLSCPGALAVISNDAFAFTISESVSGGVNEVGVLLENLGVTINGTVNGSVISMNSIVPGYPFMAGGMEIMADLEVTGSATLDDTETMLDGQLDIVAKSSATQTTLATDSCSMNGTKN